MSSNLVVIDGAISSTPERRSLAQGDVLQFDVRTSTGTVPVVWYDPTEAAARAIEPAATVTIVGTVQRRFFRSGGQTQSRTEVAVERCVLSRRRATVRAMLVDAAQRISRVGVSPARSTASG